MGRRGRLLASSHGGHSSLPGAAGCAGTTIADLQPRRHPALAGRPYWRMIADLNPAIPDHDQAAAFEAAIQSVPGMGADLYAASKDFGDRCGRAARLSAHRSPPAGPPVDRGAPPRSRRSPRPGRKARGQACAGCLASALPSRRVAGPMRPLYVARPQNIDISLDANPKGSQKSDMTSRSFTLDYT